MTSRTFSFSLLVSLLLQIRRLPMSVAASEPVNMLYHMGPVLSSPIGLYLIWYGKWRPAQQSTVRDFLLSISDPCAASPSVREWWSTAALYADQTGANVTQSIFISGEFSDPFCSHGASLTRLDIQRVIAGVNAAANVFLVLTGAEVAVEGFGGAVRGFHYFTFPSIAGDTVPYACVGNGHADVDEMVTVIGRELAELATNPLGNSWYAGEDQTAPTEIADICEGGSADVYEVNGRGGTRFRVQRLWSPVLTDCAGPSAVD